jgi:hypothetical protein
MNPDDIIREAARRVNEETARMTVPPPPTGRRSWRGLLAFGLGALATFAAIGLAVFLPGPSGDDDLVGPPGPTTTTTITLADDSIYRGTVTVIDTGDGPVVCEGFVAASYPPQCGGPPLRGLDWSQVPWGESANGVTWASMTIEVHYDVDGFAMASPPEEAQWPEGEEIDFTPPCDPPAGGWVWTDDPLATPEHMDDAISYANSQPDRSAVWVFSLMDDLVEAEQSGRQEYVVVALFTGRLDTHEAEMRSRWGGPLCVAKGTTNADQLLRIQTEVTDLIMAGKVPGILGFGSSSVDELKGVVDIGALIATSEASGWADDRYGEDVVRFVSVFTPLG